ncbi:hypothetical protein [Pelagibacterium montanilacus]|uniref:hypothetical protein n=1 Tax=Pelagibacterium montanilacus TaxID=2185280 RepID=UPI0013E0AE55|nr:hypothetical protein [Pelagibacterium montanilacus]
MEFAASPWLFAVLGGAIMLGAALAYGILKSHKASRRQREAAEQGARDLYHKDQSKS